MTGIPVATVDVAPTTADLLVGGTRQLTATPRAANGAALAGRQVAWTTGAPSVATVSNSGVVTAVGPGTVLIFATSEGRTGQATIEVSEVPVASVTVTPPTETITRIVKNSVQLSAVVRDGNGGALQRPVAWSSSNPDLALVNASGLVVRGPAVTLGNVDVVITATSGGKSGSATITVTPP